MRPAVRKKTVASRPSSLTSSPDQSPVGQVFLNCPYDPGFERPFLAYLAGVTAHGLRLRAACEIAGVPRLEKIARLISECRVSLHDFSRFGGRFNIPFEFGFAFALQHLKPGVHHCFAFSSSKERLERALSDLRGIDHHFHHGRPQQLFAEIANVFAGGVAAPKVDDMKEIYQDLIGGLPGIKRETGAKTVFAPRIFKEVATLARALNNRIVKPLAS